MASPQVQQSLLNQEQSRWSKILDILLFAVVASAAVYVFVLLSFSLHSQMNTYSTAIQSALKDPQRGDAVALAYARASDFAIIKISVIFLGFIMAFVGALYVLRTATAAFLLSVTPQQGAPASLQTSSPGLVMIALGVITINCA